MQIDADIDFDNTSVAFSYKSDNDLRKSHLLFSTMDKNLVVKLGSIFIKGALRFKLPVKQLVRNNLFDHFCGGESIDDCENTIQRLGQYKIGTILDYAVEGENNEAGFDHTAEEIIKTIQRAKGDHNIPFCVFKPTGMASVELLEKIQKGEKTNAREEDLFNRIWERWDQVCAMAAANEVKIFIDSEDSFIQDPIDDIVNRLMKKYNKEKAVVFNTYQMYRRGMLRNLQIACDLAVQNSYYLGAKLVRGAYMEKERERSREKGYPDPILPDKKSTDEAYNDALRFCMEHIEESAVCSCSHNENSNYLLVDLMKKFSIPNNDERVYFAQLFGMSDHISFNLAIKGYNVVKYVPYGPIEKVVPYLLRRAEENTSIAGQSSREYLLIKKEINRRRQLKINDR